VEEYNTSFNSRGEGSMMMKDKKDKLWKSQNVSKTTFDLPAPIFKAIFSSFVCPFPAI
jgi:hypothetical protein